MLFRRIKTHIEAENWFAVAIDFLIVVGGVFIGVQLGNWNETRNARTASFEALDRLHGEVSANIEASESMIARLDSTFDARDAGIKALMQCDAIAIPSGTIERAVAVMQGDIVPPLMGNLADDIARDTRHAVFLTPDFLAALNRHNGEIRDEMSQLAVNFGLMWDRHVIDHPAIGMQGAGADIATLRLELTVPPAELCKDDTFRRRLILTNVWHESTKMRLLRFRDNSEAFLKALDAERRRAP